MFCSENILWDSTIAVSAVLMKSVGAIILSGCLALGLARSAAAADSNSGGDCYPRYTEAADFPGLPLGFNYYRDRSKIPRSAHCGEPDRDNCEFIDRFGVRNSFTHADGRSQDLFLKEAVRARGGPLPYGVKWSDSFREVRRKLRNAGPTIRGRTIRAGACGPDPRDQGFWTDFVFDRDGRLSSVKQQYHAY